MISTVLLILAAICFAISAFSAETIGPVKLVPLGLFFWVLATLL